MEPPGKTDGFTALGWRKLRTQLVAARSAVGELAFLLVYVPGELLNGRGYGFITYEQNDHFMSMGSTDACYGATLIPVDDLLTPSGRWRDIKHKVPQLTPGRFKSGIPFWQLFMELLTCRRSTWTKDAAVLERHLPAFQTLRVVASAPAQDDWIAIQEDSHNWLPPRSHGSQG